MNRILYVTTLSMTVNAFLIPHIELLISEGYEVHLACNEVSKLTDKIKDLKITIHEVSFNRNPISIDNIRAFRSIRNILKKNNFDFVHVHTPIASAITRMALKKGTTKMIYTAHGFHFYEGAPLKNWLMYYPMEKYLSKKTDLLITINEEDFNVSQKFNVKSVVKTHGVGVDLSEYPVKDGYSGLINDLNIKNNDFVILSIGELNQNKNHQLVINALSEMSDFNFKYFICGEGKERENLQNLIDQKNLNNCVTLLGFRKDIKELLSISNLFIFPSQREGLPVSVIEAMASGVPVVASKIRGNMDLIEHNDNGLLFESNNLDDLKGQMEVAFSNKRLLNRLVSRGEIKVQSYSLSNVLHELKMIYKNISA